MISCRQLAFGFAGPRADEAILHAGYRIEGISAHQACILHSTALGTWQATATAVYWVLVKGFNLSYHDKETILFTIDPYYGNLRQIL